MDQHAEVGSVASASATDETLMGNLDTEGQIEGSFVGENGDDDGEEGELMVEVVGSDVIFDGVVSHGDGPGHIDEGGDPEIGTFEGGDGPEGGNSRIVTETEVFQHGDARCSDQEARNVVGEASEVIVRSIREKIVVLEETVVRHPEEGVTEVFQCSEAPCSGPNTDMVVKELNEELVQSAEQTEVFAVETVRRSSEDGVDTVAEDFQHTNALFDQQGQDVVGEAGEVVLQSASEPTEVVDEEIVERPSEKCGERVMAEEGVHDQTVDGVSGVDGFTLQKDGDLDSEAWNPGIEAPVEQLPLREESLSVQNLVVSEEVTEEVEGEGVHHEDGAPDGNFMGSELPCSEKDQSSEAEVVHLGTDKGQQAEGFIPEERHLEVGHSLLREESSSIQNQVVSEEATVAVEGQGPHQEDGAPDGNVMEVELPYPEKDQSSEAEVVYMGAVKDGIGSADTDVACQQAEALIKEERELMNKEDSTAERGDVTGMDIEQNLDLKDEAPGHDTLNDTENYIDKEQSLKVTRANGSSINDVAHEHPECSEKPNEFANKGDVLMGNIEEDDRKHGQAVSADSNLDSLKNNFSSPEDDVTLRAVTESESLLPSDLETSLVAKREITELDAKKDPGSGVEISNGDICHHKDENLDAQTASGNAQKQGDASVNFESSGPQAEAETQVEYMATRCQGTVEVQGHTETGFWIAVQDTAGIDHSVVGENENHHSTTSINVSSDNLFAETITVVEQPAQPPATLIYEMDHNEPTLNVDEVSNKEMSIAALPDAVTNIIDTSQAPVDPGLVDGESGHVASSVSHFAHPLLDDCQYLDVHVVNSDVSMLHGNQTRDIHVSVEMISSEGMNKATERNDEPCEIDENCADACVLEVDVPSLQEMEVDDQFTDSEHTELATEADQLGMSTDVTFIGGSSVGAERSIYLLPPESEGKFSASDLVWGKVRSHPWWPGQIFNPADASEKAIRYHKTDCFLVAYFGDRTFAWNDASLLKPFWSHFSQIEKQSNSEAFHNAVSCALNEVSRRFELGLACSCIPKDVYDKIECQIVESTGIREESSRRYGVDKFTGVSSFQPDKMLEYIRALALSPSGVTDRLEVLIAKAQLLAFCRFKGFCQLPEFQYCGGLVENDAQTSDISETIEHPIHAFEELKSDDESSHKRKHNLKDNLHPKKKEKSLVELMVDAPYSPDDEDGSAKRRKAVDSTTDGNSAKVSTAASISPRPSFKVGECIRRVASQLTGAASSVKGNSDLDVSLQTPENFQRGRIPTECSSVDQMLSQLYVTARDPMKGYSFLKTIIDFFSGFRNSIILSQHSVRQNSSAGKPGSGRKRKPSQVISSEEFEFDDVNDSYWTDRIIQNYSEEQLLHNGENGGAEYAIVGSESDKSLKSSRRSNSRKRYSSGNHEMVAEEPSNHVDEKMLDLSPAELILSFAEGDSIPSESNLNKIFRRFGPLKESDTEIDVLSSRARVVFKKGSDAKVALNSAGKFNIFGPKLVNYELSYSPNSFKYVPLMISEGQEDAI